MENKEKVETNVVKPRMSIFENDSDNRLISTFDEIKLDSEVSSIEKFMEENNGRGMTDKEKDDLYGEAQKLWNNYAETLKNVQYTFYLNRKQYQFLTDLLVDKLEYDVNTIFLAIELTDMLGNWKSEGSSKDDVSVKGYTSDATEVTYMYHLIAKYKPKGLSHASYRFAEVLKKIGDISKIISYYDTHAKGLSKDIQLWVASFEDGVEVDGKNFGKSTKKDSSKKKKEEIAD